MRKQTKKILSMVLSAAMALSLTSGINFVNASAEDETGDAVALATTFDADVDFAYSGGGQRIEIGNPWDSNADAAEVLAANVAALKGVQFTNLEISFDVAGTEKAFAAAGVTTASAVINGSLDNGWSVQRWDAKEMAGFTDAVITGDGSYTVSYADANNAVYTLDPSGAPLYVQFPELDSIAGDNGDQGLTFSNVHIKATASAYTVVDDDFDAVLGIGDGDEARVMVYNEWGGLTPATLAGIRIKEVEVSFDIANTSEAFAAAGVATTSAFVGVISSDWSVNTYTDTDPVTTDIAADGNYTVKYTSENLFTLGAQLAVVLPGLNDALTENEDGSVTGLDISNVHVKVLGMPKEEVVDPDPGSDFPDYLDEEVWGTKGIHAYIMYQTNSWDYRNGYNAGKKNADKDSYAYIQASGAEVNAEDVIVEDVLLDHNGEYTVSLEGVDLSGASAFTMLGLATDLDKYTYEGVKVDNATVSIDEEIVSGSDPVTLTAKEDNDYYTYMALNAYGAADEYYPMSAEDTDLPTDSIEITFTISGLDKALEDIENGSYIDPETGKPISGGDVPTGPAVKDPTPTPPSNNNNNNNNNSSSNNNNTVKPTAKPAAKATVVGPKVGKTFTKGNFKYKVTKAATTKSSGKVTVTGLSKKGKKAKKLSVAATVKKTGSYKVTAIAKKSFKGAKATQITLNKNIKKIPANAFANCKKLKKLTLKAKLTSVAKKSFKGCKKKITVKGTSKKANVKKLKKSGYKKFK